MGSISGGEFSFTGANIATGQVTVTTTATEIVPARASRTDLIIVKNSTAILHLGKDSTVTTTTGLHFRGPVGAAISFSTESAVFGIITSGSQLVSFLEVYN